MSKRSRACATGRAREHAALVPVFEARKRDGFVRECHGDLHLGNIVLLDGVPTPFDAHRVRCAACAGST